MACGGRQVRARCDRNCKARHRTAGSRVARGRSLPTAELPDSLGSRAPSPAAASTPRGAGSRLRGGLQRKERVGRGEAAFRGCWCPPASGRHRGCQAPSRFLSFPLGAGQCPSPDTPDHGCGVQPTPPAETDCLGRVVQEDHGPVRAAAPPGESGVEPRPFLSTSHGVELLCPPHSPRSRDQDLGESSGNRPDLRGWGRGGESSSALTSPAASGSSPLGCPCFSLVQRGERELPPQRIPWALVPPAGGVRGPKGTREAPGALWAWTKGHLPPSVSPILSTVLICDHRHHCPNHRGLT